MACQSRIRIRPVRWRIWHRQKNRWARGRVFDYYADARYECLVFLRQQEVEIRAEFK